MTPSAKSDQSAKTGRSDHWINIGFLVVALIAAGLIYGFFQTKESILPSWPEDLNAALARAKQTDRKVLVLFMANPPGPDSVFMASVTLSKSQNQQAIQNGKFARVKVIVNSLDSDLAHRYKLTRLPTMMILAPGGNELNRREGRVGEVPFLHGFLDLTEIQAPDKP